MQKFKFYNACKYILGLALGTFVSIGINAQVTQDVKASTGILPNFKSPFQAKNETINKIELSADTVKPFSITKRDNSLRIRFSDFANVSSATFFDSISKNLGVTVNDNFILEKSDFDDIGYRHYRYQQTYKGIKIEGGELLMHEKDGVLKTVNGYFFDSLNIDITPAISINQAIEFAKKNIGAEKWMWENPEAEKFLKEMTEDTGASYVPKAELIIAPINGIYKSENLRLCYKINIAAENPYEVYDVYVDVKNGEVINKISKLKNHLTPGTGQASTLYSGTRTINTDLYNGKYRLRDYTRGNGIETYDMKGTATQSTDFTNQTTTWGQEIFLKRIIVQQTNNNWESFNEQAATGGKPDIFIEIKDASNTVVYKSATIDNKFAPVTYDLSLILNNAPYEIKVWDEDFTSNDLLGTFSISASNGTFSLNDNGTVIEWTNILTSNSALDVHWGLGKAYDYYSLKFNRNSFNKTGGKIKSYVHKKINWITAQWTGYVMEFGDGDGIYSDQPTSLDVVGHEFTHAVIDYSLGGGLRYQNESGALNESFADIFGTAIEFLFMPSTANWRISEAYWRKPPFYTRDMSNPKSGFWPQPNTYHGVNWHPLASNPSLSNDHGGVHINSGVQNFWFYLLSHGGSGNIDDNPNNASYNVTEIGIENAAKIAYKTMDNYLSRNATFYDAAESSIEATIALFTINSQELESVINAWHAVGVLNSPSSFCGGTKNLTASSGVFHDGSGSAQYYNNSDCKWLIQSNGANSITLNFTEFNTEAVNDLVVVYDGATTSANVLLSWSGNSLPASVTSTTGAMLVRFITNASVTSAGWKANYTSGVTTSFCSGLTVLNTSSGSFSDGSGSNNYGNNAQCSWLIAPPGATSVDLTFSSFNTESGADGVIIYDGDNTNAPVLGTFSGSSIPPLVTSTGGKLLLVFTSDNTITASGWSAEYTSTGSAYCSGTTNLTANTASFSDGSGTNNYQNNMDCKWLIQPPGATSVTLSFNSFDLELSSPDGHTIYDAVEVFDGVNASAPLLGRYTGNAIPPNLTSTGGSMFVRFYTDMNTVKQGWAATYTSTMQGYCSGTTTLSAPSGSFTDGSGGNEYVENSDCKWLIRPTNATSIVLNFTSFETEQDYDGVIIYDGDNVFAPVLGVFTGLTIPAQVYSTGGAMLVRFISDESINENGWAASYVANISTGGSGSITEYEYWFDNNYANAIKVPVIPQNVFQLNSNIPVTNLTDGLHTYNLRFKDNSSQWSPIITNFFYKPTTVFPTGTAQYEYWFDSDFNNKTSVSIGTTNSLSVFDNIVTTNLNNGLHTINFRFKPDGKHWSSIISSFFYKARYSDGSLNRYQYWFDMNVADSITVTVPLTNNLLLVDSLITGGLPNGLHTFNVRYLQENGLWSSVTSDFFYKKEPTGNTPNYITTYKYWYDDNWQNPTSLFFSGAQNLLLDINTDADMLTEGRHKISMIVKDNWNKWSSVVSDSFTRAPITAFVCPGNRKFASGITGVVGYTYQWQVNTGSGFTNISNGVVYSGTQADTLVLSNAPTNWYGNLYRCVINTGTGNITGPSFTLKFWLTWNGSVSTVWEDPANWNCNQVPDGNIDVSINTGSTRLPEINTLGTCRSLSVKPGVMITVKTGANFIITH